MSEPAAKEQALCDALASLDSVIVAYSGGVDSAYLAYIASRTLGDRAVAVTADSPSYPERHRALAIRIAKDFGSTPTSPASPPIAAPSSSTATTPTTAATIARGGRRRASSASVARSTKWI